ncbi:hypothetical protein Pelo_12412 [Pelomyxa schiedti]|nr:hypothetical protein Pelo_12412 [Pelomyxa schiedti]
MFVVGTEGKIYEIHQGAYNRWRWDCFCISDAIPSIKPPASLPQVKKSDQMTAITYRTSDGELVVLAALAQQRWTWFSEVIPMIPSPAWRPDSTNLCDVCMENPKNVVLLPCRHMLCLNCSKSLSNCPHCRETIVDRMTVFL